MAIKPMTFFLLFLISIVASRKTSTPNSHVIKTIRVLAKDGGDIVDCVDIYKQPAFNHPALKNHTIQMSSHLDSTMDEKRNSRPQAWLKYGSCPNGTIPIRRPTSKHQTNISQSNDIVTPEHSFSVVLTQGFSYSGAKANIKVWNPYVEPEGPDYSSSQVMLRNGPLKTFSMVQAGWAVYPKLYGDGETRLFAYWTDDGMQNTGCFDLRCTGFVQTSSEILLGGFIGDLWGSEIVIQISRDPFTYSWWLKYNDKQVGYWPGNIFSELKYQATLVQWGGEVYSPKVGTHPHTSTEMGSGEYADYLFGRSGTMKGMLIEENSHELKRPETTFVISDEWDCYDAKLVNERGREFAFYYGGPGSYNNPRCS